MTIIEYFVWTVSDHPCKFLHSEPIITEPWPLNRASILGLIVSVTRRSSCKIDAFVKGRSYTRFNHHFIEISIVSFLYNLCIVACFESKQASTQLGRWHVTLTKRALSRRDRSPKESWEALAWRHGKFNDVIDRSIHRDPMVGVRFHREKRSGPWVGGWNEAVRHGRREAWGRGGGGGVGGYQRTENERLFTPLQLNAGTITLGRSKN